LFHLFFYPGESLQAGRERLRRQLDWLSQHYEPITPEQAAGGLANGHLPRFPVLVTIDDAHRDFLKVQDIFKSFDVPVLMFVCVGWSDIAGPPEPRSLLARIVTLLQWGDSLDEQLSLGSGFPPIRLGEQFRADRTAAIDQLIAARDDIEHEFEALAAQLDHTVKVRNSCTWRELEDLSGAGTVIGCHSISHVSLAKASKTRMVFEIGEAHDILREKFDRCRYFAYPFGTVGSFNPETTAEIIRSGFECAFLTHADFATSRTDRYHLPRFVIPDSPASLNEFRAIVRGGGIPIDWAKRWIGIAQHST
jgi:peptidoglycan/xylan/chitin deacetylase (PgdA/CDA1 family)